MECDHDGVAPVDQQSGLADSGRGAGGKTGARSMTSHARSVTYTSDIGLSYRRAGHTAARCADFQVDIPKTDHSRPLARCPPPRRRHRARRRDRAARRWPKSTGRQSPGQAAAGQFRKAGDGALDRGGAGAIQGSLTAESSPCTGGGLRSPRASNHAQGARSGTRRHRQGARRQCWEHDDLIAGPLAYSTRARPWR